MPCMAHHLEHHTDRGFFSSAFIRCPADIKEAQAKGRTDLCLSDLARITRPLLPPCLKGTAFASLQGRFASGVCIVRCVRGGAGERVFPRGCRLLHGLVRDFDIRERVDRRVDDRAADRLGQSGQMLWEQASSWADNRRAWCNSRGSFQGNVRACGWHKWSSSHNEWLCR